MQENIGICFLTDCKNVERFKRLAAVVLMEGRLGKNENKRRGREQEEEERKIKKYLLWRKPYHTLGKTLSKSSFQAKTCRELATIIESKQAIIYKFQKGENNVAGWVLL